MSEPRFCGEVSKRSHYNMSKIHGKDTSIEIILRKALWAQGIRYRKNYKGIPGSPDIAITKYKMIRSFSMGRTGKKNVLK